MHLFILRPHQRQLQSIISDIYRPILDKTEYQIITLDMQVWPENTAENTPYSKSTLLLCSTVRLAHPNVSIKNERSSKEGERGSREVEASIISEVYVSGYSQRNADQSLQQGTMISPVNWPFLLVVVTYYCRSQVSLVAMKNSNTTLTFTSSSLGYTLCPT